MMHKAINLNVVVGICYRKGYKMDVKRNPHLKLWALVSRARFNLRFFEKYIKLIYFFSEISY